LIFIFIALHIKGFSQEEWPPGLYDDRRFKENWELKNWELRDQLARNYADKIKNIGLTKNKKIWLSVGGQARIRYMATINEEFKNRSIGLFTLRGRLFGHIHLGKNFAVFVEGIYSNTTNEESERIGLGSPVNQGAFLNIFAQYNFRLGKYDNLGLWIGRRELQAGHERFVSPGNWLNTRRSWDGAGFFIGNGKRRISGFWSRPVIVVPDGYSKRDDETEFWGFRYQNKEIAISTNAGFGVQSWSSYSEFHFEPYIYGLHRKSVRFEQGTAREDRYTVGILVSGPISNGLFNFEFEGAYQMGRFGEVGINAYSVTAEFGISPPLFWNPHFWVGFDYSTGDKDSNDSRMETFDPMYPQAAQWFGEHAMVDRKNLLAYSMNIDFLVMERIESRISYWRVFRSHKGDAVYNTANGILRPAIVDGSKDQGHTMQLSCIYPVNYQFEITATYNVWFPGQFYEQSQSTHALIQHFIMLTAQYTF